MKKFLPLIPASLNAVSSECQIHKKVIAFKLLLIAGHVPLAFITATHISPSPAVLKELNALVRKKIGAISSLEGVIVLERIPKTRSGKTLRRILKEIVEKGIQGDWESRLSIPATIEDSSHVDWAREKIKSWIAEQSKIKAKL